MNHLHGYKYLVWIQFTFILQTIHLHLSQSKKHSKELGGALKVCKNRNGTSLSRWKPSSSSSSSFVLSTLVDHLFQLLHPCCSSGRIYICNPSPCFAHPDGVIPLLSWSSTTAAIQLLPVPKHGWWLHTCQNQCSLLYLRAELSSLMPSFSSRDAWSWVWSYNMTIADPADPLHFSLQNLSEVVAQHSLA